MVKNLLNSGHTVTVWNRTTEKVRDFLEGEIGENVKNIIMLSGIC